MFGLGYRRERTAAQWVARMGNESAAFDRAAFERWRSAHPDNARAFDQASTRWGLNLAIDQTSFAQQRPGAAGVNSKMRDVAPFAVAALVVAAVGGIVFGAVGMFWSHAHDVGRPGVSHVVMATDAPRTFRLSDGSLATLQPGSALEIAFSADLRSLALLRGQSRFDVAHDRTRPFQVRAGASFIVARGTLFDVQLTAHGVHVVLVHGAIEVERLVGLRPTGEVRKLVAGQKLLVPPSGSLGKPTPAEPNTTTAALMTAFDRTPVLEAIATVNRRNACQIAILGNLDRTETISGGFDARDPDGFAGMLATMFDLNLVRRDNGDLVLSARR